MKRFTITTLGCKVNQCESAALARQLEDAGYGNSTDGPHPDLIVVNTCTVTGKAATQSRQAIRQAARNHPGARIVVTGCYAQTAPDEIQSLPEVDLIVGHGDKLNLTRHLDRMRDGQDAPPLVHGPTGQLHQFAPLPTAAPVKRTRAFLKIQDGCNAFCTYCIVPHARGRSRSMPRQDVMAHLQRLSGAGYRETVLTGIHLGAYGQDFEPPASLAALLEGIRDDGAMERIRISSVEPTEVDPAIIDMMADRRGPICPHFHIPLQSGDDTILQRMGRPYSGDQFADVVRTIHAAIPQAAVGVDVLVGFPGESEAAFQRTLELIASLPVAYLHVFPFSPRKGTPAARFKDRVPDPQVKARCRQLRRLGDQKRSRFYRDQVGHRVPVLVETARDAATGHAKGMSDNYIPICIADAAVAENQIVPVRIERVDDQGIVWGRRETS